jgi:indolepyruvate ferredoxin oxidoreductase
MERALIGEYRDTVEALLPKLSGKPAQAVAIARIPEDIRGYGHVKERHLKAAKAEGSGAADGLPRAGQRAAGGERVNVITL